MTLELTDSNFNNLIADLVVIDFWSPYCRPCLMLAPAIESISDKNPDVVVGKLNIAENPLISSEFKISSIPTIMFFKHGKVVEKLVGLQTEDKLQKIIDKLR